MFRRVEYVINERFLRFLKTKTRKQIIYTEATQTDMLSKQLLSVPYYFQIQPNVIHIFVKPFQR